MNWKSIAQKTVIVGGSAVTLAQQVQGSPLVPPKAQPVVAALAGVPQVVQAVTGLAAPLSAAGISLGTLVTTLYHRVPGTR